MARYIHELPEWPNFTWDHAAIAAQLAEIHQRRGALLTAMATMGFEVRQEANLAVLVQDIVRSSAIEGENLDAQQVMSSIARHLGMEYAGLPTPARSVEGVVQLMLDATQNYAQPLTDNRIFAWHVSLFPQGISNLSQIKTGAYRDTEEPMQVISGPYGKRKVHFEAPASKQVPREMAHFLKWFETERLDPVVKAAIAHLWFVTIHPLEDGNGRIGRAIMDMALARADGDRQRFYSMSAQIHHDKNEYYELLERTQKGTMNVTPWIVWFLKELRQALDSAEHIVQIVHRKKAFWDVHGEDVLSDRQRKIIEMLFEGFQGKLQTAKYAKITKCSTDTALRDLQDLVEKGILTREGDGRSTHYTLAA